MKTPALLLALALPLVACAGTVAPPRSAPAEPALSGAIAPPTSSVPPVKLPNGASGFVAKPPGAGQHPALIVVQEWWGVDDWMKGNTARFAQQGYVALAVDLYRGKATSSPDEAHELMRGMPEDRAMADMQSAFDWLATQPDVDSSRIGIVGWCMGGGYALAFATAQPKLRAAAMNYGRLVTAPEKIQAIHASLLGNFAGQDRGIAVADVRTFEQQLKDGHKDVDIKVYDPDGHGFMNPNNKKGYDEAAATDAWSRIDAFFKKTLGT
jgi:carboxymethylenebutenolidase